MQEAVAAILVSGDDIFTIRRQNHLRAFPGYTAFPGGKIDPEDAAESGPADEGLNHPLLSSFERGQIKALIRELKEELGFDLRAALGRDEVVAIDLFGTAITPAFSSQRFAAHHFKITLKNRPEFSVDEQEIAASGWRRKESLWQAYLDGQALMVVPTMRTLRALAHDINAKSCHPFNLDYDEDAELPYLELLNGLGLIPVPSHTLPPAKATNCLRLGDAVGQRYLVDPSPASPAVLEKLLKTLEAHPVDAIFISHHHPDHHAYLPELAGQLGLPVSCSKITRERLERRWGEAYLAGLDLRYLSDGDRLTRWLGRDVICQALPGHDDGMLGLAPTDFCWFFVADLAQVHGSIVIPEDEGDMTLYFRSLERVIAAAPAVTLPSHGMPSGGSALIERTLKHRKMREQQVLAHHAQGLDIEATVDAIYPDISEKLRPLARQTIGQHWRKLSLEGKRS